MSAEHSDSPVNMDMAEHRAAWSGFVAFIQLGGLLCFLILAHATMVAALGMDWMVSLLIVVVTGVLAKTAMKMPSVANFYLIGVYATILLAHIVIALVGMMLA